MKKILPVTILLLLHVLWYLSREWMGTSFHNISSWGIYLFSVPFVYCLMVLFIKQGTVKQKIAGTLFATWGVILAILLYRLSFIESYALMKIAMTLLGAALCLGAIEYNNRRSPRKTTHNEQDGEDVSISE